ncbi:family 16 glycoside hydrolase [Methylorubrum extorquens]
MPLKRLIDRAEEELLPKLKPEREDQQATTFSIDGISRFVCNTWQEVKAARGSRGFDIIIIGSGMYGSYVAAKLFDFGESLGSAAPRIVVLEAGPFLISEHIQNLTRVGELERMVFEPLVGPATQRVVQEPGNYNGSGLISDHARCVGGKSLFWGGWAPRLREDDLRRVGSPWPPEVVNYLFQTGVPAAEIRDGYPFIEWEIGAAESTDFIQGKLYQELLSRAQAVTRNITLGGGNDTHLDAPLPPPVAVQGQAPESGLFSFDKYSSLILLLDAIRRDAARSDKDRRLFLVPNAQAVRIETGDGLATGVRAALIDRLATGVYKDKNLPKIVGSVDTLELNAGGCVILAAHAIESARLALNSFPRPATLGPELMGRNLMAHVRGNHVWQVKRSAFNLPSGVPLGNAAMHIPGLSRRLPQPNRQGHFHFQFYASANVPPTSGDGPKNAEEYLYMLLPNFDEIQRIREAQDEQTVALGIRTCGEMIGDRDTSIPTNVPISWMDTPGPGVADELFLDEAGNVLERAPRAFVKLVETPEDLAVRQDQTAAAFQFIAFLTGVDISETGSRFDTVQEFLSSANKVRYITGNSRDQDGVGTTYHESGTLWMGEDPSTSVTDVHGRFHHVSNAYCCDQALFPTVGSANPVPTGLALSRKVARGITRRFTSGPTLMAPEPGFQLLYSGDFVDWGGADVPNFFNVAVPGQPPILGAGIDNDSAMLGVLWFRRKKFRDFELRLQWRVFSARANGGIFLRAPEPVGNLFAAGGFYEQALEVQIDERGFDPRANLTGSPKHRTGALYSRLPATRWASRAVSPRDGRPGYWNDYAIKIQGTGIEVRLNDELVCSGPHDAPLSEGYIGVQCHTEVVQYRSVRVREL